MPTHSDMSTPTIPTRRCQLPTSHAPSRARLAPTNNAKLRHGWVFLAATLGVSVLTGCVSDRGNDGGAAVEAREVEPGDFVQVGGPSGVAPADRIEAGTVGVESVASAQTNAEPPGPQGSVADAVNVTVVETVATIDPVAASVTSRMDRPLSVDGMVGQINGLPVFADDVLADLEPALLALGQRESERGFRAAARPQIDEMLRGQLVGALILAEAERALTDNEWNGVRFLVNKKRQELLRQHGQGSIAVTERSLRELTGRSLEETLDRHREAIVTRTYIDRNLRARVNVSRRDIERYYREHPEQFDPPATRDLRLIVADNADHAAQVKSALRGGQPFDEVASGPFNQLAGGGTMTGIAGDEPFGRPVVDEVVAVLDEGQWRGPLDTGDGRFWFVQAQRVERGETLTFEQAQGIIERALQEQQFAMLTDQFRKDLLEAGNYTRPEQMVNALLEIAVNRYAQR